MPWRRTDWRLHAWSYTSRSSVPNFRPAKKTGLRSIAESLNEESPILFTFTSQLTLEHVPDGTLRQPRDNPFPRPEEHTQRPGRNLSSPKSDDRPKSFANQLHDDFDLRSRDIRAFSCRNRLQHVFRAQRYDRNPSLLIRIDAFRLGLRA